MMELNVQQILKSKQFNLLSFVKNNRKNKDLTLPPVKKNDRF